MADVTNPGAWADIQALMTLVGPVVVLVTGGVAYGGVKAKVATALARAEAAEKKAQTAADDLAKFRVDVTRDFASRDGISELEGRLMAAIDRLGDRLDRVLDRPHGPKA